MRLDIGRRLGLFGVGAVAAAFAVLPATGAAEGSPSTRWLGAWATSPSPPDLGGPSVAGFANQTLREVVSLHFAGGAPPPRPLARAPTAPPAPAGAEIRTDPANLRVRAGQELAVSLFLPAA